MAASSTFSTRTRATSSGSISGSLSGTPGAALRAPARTIDRTGAAPAGPADLTITGEDLRTPLHQRHVEAGGQMVEFGGWSMPLQYSSMRDEHHAVRQAVG